LAADQDKDPRHMQVILDETQEVLRAEGGVMICVTRNGLVCANAGVDASNAEAGEVILLPVDPDESARRLRARIAELRGVRPAVVVTDSFGRPWRTGQTDVAIGAAGPAPLGDWRRRPGPLGPTLPRRALAGASAATLDGVSPVPSGVSKARSWIVSSGNHPVVRGSRGVVIRGRAYAPSRAPYQVKLVIWSANQIRHKPYKWGGGHGTWNDSGYDCSGSVSYALHGGGLLSYPLDSRGFIHWGDPGHGRWITVYATNG